MTDSSFIEIAQALNGFVGLAVAVWIIQIGIKRMDTMQDKHNEFVRTVLSQQQQNNDELMQLVSTLCTQVEIPVRLKQQNSPN